MSSSSRPTPRRRNRTGLSRPRRVGYFSLLYDPRRQSFIYHNNSSGLRYYISPCTGQGDVDLLNGYRDNVKWGRTPQSKMFILDWIRNNHDLNKKLGFDFICQSRSLRSILEAPFNTQDNWELVAVKVGNTIVIDEMDTEQRQIQLYNQSSAANAGSYAGYKYIELSTRCKDGSRSATHPGGYRDSFYTVNEARIGNHSLLYSYGVDCIIDRDQYERPLERMQFATLATRSLNWNSPNRIGTWQSRAVRWWAESVVSGIDTIFCGEKARGGNRLSRVVQMNAKNLPYKHQPWSPKVCFDSLNKTLSLIKSIVTEELVPYSFQRQPHGDPSYEQLDDPVENLIPSWFIESQATDDYIEYGAYDDNDYYYD